MAQLAGFLLRRIPRLRVQPLVGVCKEGNQPMFLPPLSHAHALGPSQACRKRLLSSRAPGPLHADRTCGLSGVAPGLTVGKVL